MTRTVTLQLNEFGQRALDRLLDRGMGSPDEALRDATLYYLSDRDSGRAAWRAPRFRSAPEESITGFRADYDDGTWAALEEEAVRQGVAPERLAVHALMYFLAAIDSGRVTEP